MKVRHAIALIICILLAGCGKKGPRLPWPASIHLTGFADSESEAIRKSFSDLNEKSGKTVVEESGHADRYPIRFEIVDFPKDKKTQAGLAIIEDETCTIQLSRSLFTDSAHPTYLMPVVWHELGHCAGLLHNPSAGEIMFSSTVPFENYSEEEIKRFFADLFQSSGL
jgi:hypothetical protein